MQHLSPCVVSLQKTFLRTKQGHLSNVWDVYHRHPLIDSTFSFFRHNRFFPDINLLPSHFFKFFCCHPLLALCCQHDGCSPCFRFLFLTQKRAKCSCSPVPLKCGEADPVHTFFEMHHQDLFLFYFGNKHSSVFAFQGSTSGSEVLLLFIFFKASVTFQHSRSFQFNHEAFSVSLLPFPASFFTSLATFLMCFLCTFQ